MDLAVHVGKYSFIYIMTMFKSIYGKPAIQIGSNIGSDSFYDICKNYNPSEIVLIEPYLACHEQLRECYRDLTQPIHYEALAIISDDNITEVAMRSSTGRTEHTSIIPLKGWSDNIVLYSPATTITKIFDKYKFTDIGLLYIDTEGNDARIIDSIDLDKFNIDIIVYESWGFSQESYDDYNILNGIDGMNYIKLKLESKGYTVNSIDDNTNIIAYK